MTKKLVSASATTGTSPTYAPRRDPVNTGLTVNIGVSLSSTGSVTVQGSFDAGTTWLAIGSAITTSGISAFAMAPLMRVNVTANAGTANIWLME